MSTEAKIQPLRRSQRDRIAELLEQAYPSEVPSYRLAEQSLQYSARIRELRDLGWVIGNRVELRDGRKFGYFCLVRRAGATPTTMPLFAPTPVRYVDPEEVA